MDFSEVVAIESKIAATDTLLQQSFAFQGLTLLTED